MIQVNFFNVNGLNSNFKRHLTLKGLRNSGVNVIIIEMHFDKKGTLAFANRYFLSWLLLTPKKTAGVHCSLLLIPTSIPKANF